MPGKLTGPAPLGARTLLTRILEQPNLVAAVQALPAPALGKLVNHVGLEDAGEIVALATTDQIRRIFDDDLWRSPRPGQDETFDADRFTLWLEIMLEVGEAFAAQRLAELPEDLVTLGLQRQVLVINIEEMAVTMSSRQSDDDALLEKALESCLSEEIGEYRIIARRHDGWDAVIGVLLALDRDHHDYLARVLDRCCYAAAEYIEDSGGLYDVLTSEEMLEADAAAEREDRRAEEGYLSPSSAASFLALARTTPLAEIIRATERDPITKAYFRELRPRVEANAARSPATKQASGADPADAREAVRLVELLRDAEVLPKAQVRGLLAPPVGGAAAAQAEDKLGQAMRRLLPHGASEHARRMEELAFLANVLAAGCSIEDRAFRPAEAAQAALAVANLGLEHLVEHTAKTADVALREGADKLFRIGWRLLAEEVAIPTARKLEAVLAAARGRERGRDPALERAAATLHSALAAGKPWTARQPLAAVEGLGSRPLLGLIDECPHLHGNLEAGAGSKAAGADGEVEFISTGRQLRAAKTLLRDGNK